MSNKPRLTVIRQIVDDKGGLPKLEVRNEVTGKTYERKATTLAKLQAEKKIELVNKAGERMPQVKIQATTKPNSRTNDNMSAPGRRKRRPK